MRILSRNGNVLITEDGKTLRSSMSDHNTLVNRDFENQHPITAITGLEDALAEKIPLVQDPEDAGKILTIGEDGTVSPKPAPESGTTDHAQLENRDAENQHPIGAITGLQNELDNKAEKDSGASANEIAVFDENGNPTGSGHTLDEYVRYSSLVVTCVTTDGVTVTGQTVTLKKTDASGEVYATAAYEGQPVTFLVPGGFAYYVSVSDTLAGHTNPTTASGIVNAGTVNVTLTYASSSAIETFGDIKAALNAGVDLSDHVGETVTAARQGEELVFDIVDYDETEKAVTLLLHDTMPDKKKFEPAQALAYFADRLSAGSYSFVDGDNTYYFILTEPIPAGGQLEVTSSALTTFNTYASQDASSIIETGEISTTEIAGATDIGTTGADNINNSTRAVNGSNNAGESGLFAWLNSDALPNTNLPRINKFSRPYSSGADGGFLNGFDADDLACVADTTWTLRGNYTYEAPASMGGIAVKGQTYTITGKFGLAQFVNIGLSGNDPWDLYEDAADADRIKYYNGVSQRWWVFGISEYSAVSESFVTASGGSNGGYANSDIMVVPCCKIVKDN